MTRAFIDWCYGRHIFIYPRKKLLAAFGQFADEINKRAEKKMLLTGKLEDSHKAAMDELLKEWGLQ